MQAEESTLAGDARKPPLSSRNKNGSPTRPRTVFDRMEGQKRALNQSQSAPYLESPGRRPVTSSSVGMGSSALAPEEEDGNENTRDFGVQAAPLPWARYYFPEDLGNGAERTTMPFYKHFDVVREEDHVDPTGRYLGALPDWAADRYIMLHYAEFSQDPAAKERGSVDFAPWDTSIYDDHKFNEKTRMEVMEFLIHVSRFSSRSPADQEPLLELQRAIVGYCVKQLDLAYKQAEILFDHKMDSYKQALQADLERRKAEVQIEERDKQEELMREVDRLRNELSQQKDRYADAIVQHQNQVDDLKKDIEKLETRWKEETERQSLAEEGVRNLRHTVEALDKLGIRDKKDAERVHNETVKDIAKVSMVNDDPIAEHANVIARSCLRWVLRALTGLDPRSFDQGPSRGLATGNAPSFKHLFDDVKTDADLAGAMGEALEKCRQWRPHCSIAIWKTKVKPRGPGAILQEDGSKGTVLSGLEATEDIRMQVVGGLLEQVSAPAHFKVVATSRVWDGPALGGGRVYVLPIYPRKYHGGGRTLNPACGVLALGLERPPVESDRHGFFDPQPVAWGEGPDAQMLAVYGGLCTALGSGMEELQREKARAATRAKEAAAADRFADMGVDVEDEEPTQWWEFIYKIGSIRSRERLLCRTLEEAPIPKRSLKELRQMAHPADTVVASVAAALLAMGDADVAAALPGGEKEGGEEGGGEGGEAAGGSEGSDIIRMPYEDTAAMRALWEVVKPKIERPAELLRRMRASTLLDPEDTSPKARLAVARFKAAIATVHIIPQEDATAASFAGGLLREWTVLQGRLDEYTRLKLVKERQGHSHYSLAADTGELYNEEAGLSARSMAILARATGGEVLEE